MWEITDRILSDGWEWRQGMPVTIRDNRGTWYRLLHRNHQYYLEPVLDHRRAAAADHDD